MKFVDEYRGQAAVRQLAEAIAAVSTRPITIMEICGGQTHSILRHGLSALLPPSLTLIHGPGCPVCVTSTGLIDAALALARRPNLTVCSFGDMLRVPGRDGDLLGAKAAGADVRTVYSPLDAVQLARQLAPREVVFFGVGFETTAPATAMAVMLAARDGVRNFSVLASHVLVPPAIEAILSAPDNRIQAFLAAGHVCTIMGAAAYVPIAARWHVPIAITGFEPVDILDGVLACVRQLAAGRAEVENRYARVVHDGGNSAAQAMVARVYRATDREWRGIGRIDASGLALQPEFAAFDAATKFGLTTETPEGPSDCRAGEVLIGKIRPTECAAFGVRCTPERPLGAPMVSSEGACAAYWRYRQPTTAVPAGTAANSPIRREAR